MVSLIAPIGDSSFFSRFFFGEKLLQKAGKWMAENA
jgi:hypothetical protein